MPACTVGARAVAYAFPAASVTDTTCDTASFQPMTTTFRSPADCTVAYAMATLDCAVCGTAYALCTNEIDDVCASPRRVPRCTATAARRATIGARRKNGQRRTLQPIRILCSRVTANFTTFCV